MTAPKKLAVGHYLYKGYEVLCEGKSEWYVSLTIASLRLETR